jgi:hypothetical protein
LPLRWIRNEMENWVSSNIDIDIKLHKRMSILLMRIIKH